MSRYAKRWGKQQGSAMILSVIMLMCLGLLVLNTLSQQLSGAILSTGNEYRYLQAWERASSSLNWGLHQQWPLSPTKEWQCQARQESTTYLLISCLKLSLRSGVLLLKGEGVIAGLPEPVVLYQQAKTGFEINTLLPLAHGWLDYCPEADEQACNATNQGDESGKGF